MKNNNNNNNNLGVASLLDQCLSGPLHCGIWFRTAINRDVSNGSLVRSFAHSLALLTHLLIRSHRSLICLACTARCVLLRSFVISLIHSQAKKKVIIHFPTRSEVRKRAVRAISQWPSNHVWILFCSGTKLCHFETLHIPMSSGVNE